MRKIYFGLITLLFLLFFPLEINFAQTQENFTNLQTKIQLLQQKIKQISQLIVDLKLIKGISAQSYLVTNLSDNSILLEKNKDRQYIPASTIKLMTALITFENIDPNQTITLNKEMLSPLGWSPALYSGLNVSAKNLLKASLIQSTNDAAFSLTFFLQKGEFLDLMNKKAKELNMTNTVFYDVHGLSQKNRTSASDMTKLLFYIYRNQPEILDITRDNNFWLPGPNGKLLKFKNVNEFYELPEFIGGKTGYLKIANQNLASIFNVNGQPTAIVLFSSKNRQSDVLKILYWLKNNFPS